MRAPTRWDGGDGTRGHDAAADGRAAPAQRRVVHQLWGTRRTPAGALLPRAEGQPAACWGSRERHMARRAEETSTLQVRTRVLNGEWDVPFRTWYQGFRAHAQPTAA